MNIKDKLKTISKYYFNIPNPELKQREHTIREFYDKEYIDESLKLDRDINKIFSYIKNTLNLLEGFAIYQTTTSEYTFSDYILPICACEFIRLFLNKTQKQDSLFFRDLENYEKSNLYHQSLDEIAEDYSLAQEERIYGNGNEWKEN